MTDVGVYTCMRVFTTSRGLVMQEATKPAKEPTMKLVLIEGAMTAPDGGCGSPARGR